MTFQTAAVLLLVASARAAAPAAPATPAILPGQDVTLKTEDGWTLAGKYLPSGAAPQTFILLHGKGERKEIWIRLAAALEKMGYGYFGVDLRGHGESGVGPDGQPAPWRKFKATSKDNDFEGMSHDINAAVAWLVADGVPEETIGIIGTDVGGSVGLKYAAVHPKVPVIVLLSPRTNYDEVTTVNAIRAYKNRPILLMYSDADRFASRDAPVLYAFARMAAGEKNAMMISVPKIPGVKLPVSRSVISQLTAWIQNPVKTDAPAVSTVPVTGEPPEVDPDNPFEPGEPEPDEAPQKLPQPAPGTAPKRAPQTPQTPSPDEKYQD